MRGEENTMWSV